MTGSKLRLNNTNDRSVIEEKVKDKIGKSVRLEENEAVIAEFESVTSVLVPAILVKEHGGAGAIYIHAESAELVDMVRTGPEQPENFSIIFLEEGQNCRFYGRPSVRFFRLCG